MDGSSENNIYLKKPRPGLFLLVKQREIRYKRFSL